ncbi:MAG: hypothetical protein RL458_1328 [Pseudomonadota bacterium]|jgi:hypothetical protein
MSTCPHCLGPGRVIESKKCRNGSSRRRHECKDCGSRWTTHKGDPPEQKYRPPVSTGPLSYYQCQQWHQDRCRMGFPDPVEEGPEFANDCLTFLPRSGAKATSSTH